MASLTYWITHQMHLIDSSNKVFAIMKPLNILCALLICMATSCFALPLPTSLSSWELSGALAARNKQRGWTAMLNWIQQGPNQYQIRLIGPLGGGSVIIEKHGTVITYRDGAKRITSNNADALLQRKTGVRLPVKNLYYWIRGLPAPGPIQSVHRDAHHYLTAFDQAGYTIRYTAYTMASGMNLPSKIHLQGHGILIKLVIKHWKI